MIGTSAAPVASRRRSPRSRRFQTVAASRLRSKARTRPAERASRRSASVSSAVSSSATRSRWRTRDRPAERATAGRPPGAPPPRVRPTPAVRSYLPRTPAGRSRSQPAAAKPPISRSSAPASRTRKWARFAEVEAADSRRTAKSSGSPTATRPAPETPARKAPPSMERRNGPTPPPAAASSPRVALSEFPAESEKFTAALPAQPPSSGTATASGAPAPAAAGGCAPALAARRQGRSAAPPRHRRPGRRSPGRAPKARAPRRLAVLTRCPPPARETGGE